MQLPECGDVIDSDGDGVYDDKDKCPGTPKGVTVDAMGCPLDSDGDGVADYKDKCPGTKAGAKVDADGCEIVVAPAPKPAPMQKVVLNDVLLFDFDSAVLKESATGAVDRAYAKFHGNPNVRRWLSPDTPTVKVLMSTIRCFQRQGQMRFAATLSTRV